MFRASLILSCIMFIILSWSYFDIVEAGTRKKRFLHSLGSFFHSSTTTSTIIPITNADKVSSFGSGYEISEITSYLTPPPLQPSTLRYSSPYVQGQDSWFEQQTALPYFQTDIDPNEDSGSWNYQPNYWTSSYSEIRTLGVKFEEITCTKGIKKDNGRLYIRMVSSFILPTAPVVVAKSNAFNYDDNFINNYINTNSPKCSTPVTMINLTAYEVDVHGEDLFKCGIYNCEANHYENNLMCLTIRFPQYADGKINDDVIVKIECRPQQPVALYTQKIKLKTNVQGKSPRSPTPVVVKAGNINPKMNVQIAFYLTEKASSSVPLRENESILIGQELQLRASVLQGDGWNYVRFGRISVKNVLMNSEAITDGYFYGTDHSYSNENNDSDSVVILADDGCLNPRMKTVCPLDPIVDSNNPLMTMLNLKAFLFSSMKDGGEMLFSVTVVACVYYEDCFESNNTCDEAHVNVINEENIGRYRRGIGSSFDDQAVSEMSVSEIRLKILPNYQNANEDAGCVHCTEMYKITTTTNKTRYLNFIFLAIGIVLILTLLVNMYFAFKL